MICKNKKYFFNEKYEEEFKKESINYLTNIDNWVEILFNSYSYNETNYTKNQVKKIIERSLNDNS